MKFALLFLALVASLRAQVPAEVATAVAAFRTDGPKGWSFNQTTTAGDESLVEHYDAAKPEFTRWSLVMKNGVTPKSSDANDYQEMQSRRSSAETAPALMSQIDLAHGQAVQTAPDFVTYRCPLLPGEASDKVATHLRATFVYHRPTRSIVRFELSSIEGFSPTFGVSIDTMQTVIEYSLPAGDKPSLIERVSTRVRGRAFLFKSLDQDMVITDSDYTYAGKRPARRTSP